MKKLLLALALLLAPTASWAQCTGIFGANTVCGSQAGGVPGPLSTSAFALAPGGTTGQIQYNAGSGALGGFTASGDFTINTTTGVGLLASTAVTPTTYGDATHVGQFTVDSKGRLTSAAAVAITFPTGGIGSTSAVTGGSTTYTSAQNSVLVLRSNSGTSMSDTLPGTSPGILPSQTIISVTNNDSAGLLAIAAGSGAAIKGSSLLFNGYIYIGPGQTLQFYSDGSNYWVINSPGRAKLFVNTTLLISSSGSDTTGNGITTALATLPKARSLAQSVLDLNALVLTYSLATGNYAANWTLTGPQVGSCGAACEIIQGNTTTPSNVTIGASTATLAQLTIDQAQVQLQGIEFNPVTGQSLYATNGAIVNFQQNITQASTGSSLTAANNAVLNIIGNYQAGSSTSSNEGAHWNANDGGRIRIAATGVTITVAGAPAWGTAFAVIQMASGIFFDFVPTFSGTSSGNQCSPTFNGVINTAGHLSSLPGTASSCANGASGGQVN
jgi:hypothetical protein